MSGFDIKSILGDGGISSRSNIDHHSELNIPTLNTENNVIPRDVSSYVRSPYFNIPAGLSPTTLLESPIFLSSSLDQQSPTTGKFEFAPANNGNQFDNMDSNFFSFRPVIESGHSSFLGASSKITAVHESSMFQSRTENEPPKIPISRSEHSHYLPTDFYRGDTVNSHAGGSVVNSPPLAEEANQTDSVDANRGVDASDDGYNWRKYGQKQVKGSDYPRSYYKCTHPSCTVKKKVERSYEGHITEIIYKGAHNHAKPHPNRGSTLGLIDPRSDNNVQTGVMFDGSSAFSNDDDDDEDESDSKKRIIEKSGGTGAIKKPKVVVQTTSQVDILDDGYHWRKYGQKVVKGNPNPRSYYKCTSPGCIVRKHVERASHDLNSVITMYEGKHNHEVPATRKSGYSNSGSPTNGAAQVGNTISVSTHLHKPDKSRVMNSLDVGYGMNEAGLANLAMAQLGPNHSPPIQPCFGEMGFVLPKGESNLESVSNSSSAYNQIMRNL